MYPKDQLEQQQLLDVREELDEHRQHVHKLVLHHGYQHKLEPKLGLQRERMGMLGHMMHNLIKTE